MTLWWPAFRRTLGATAAVGCTIALILIETMARQYFEDPGNAVAQTLIVLSGRSDKEEPLEVVGVIGDVRHGGLDKPPAAELFRPLTQTFIFPMAMVARTEGPPAQLAAAARQLAFEIDPVVPVTELRDAGLAPGRLS